MDTDTKVFFGRILGEILLLKLRSNQGSNPESPATIYGLLNGIESTIDEEVERTGFVSKKAEDQVVSILSYYFDNAEKLETFRGYYDIEHQLQESGVTRLEAILIITKLKAQKRFVSLINKIEDRNHPYSPVELHDLDVEIDDL